LSHLISNVHILIVDKIVSKDKLMMYENYFSLRIIIFYICSEALDKLKSIFIMVGRSKLICFKLRIV